MPSRFYRPPTRAIVSVLVWAPHLSISVHSRGLSRLFQVLQGLLRLRLQGLRRRRLPVLLRLLLRGLFRLSIQGLQRPLQQHQHHLAVAPPLRGLLPRPPNLARPLICRTTATAKSSANRCTRFLSLPKLTFTTLGGRCLWFT